MWTRYRGPISATTYSNPKTRMNQTTPLAMGHDEPAAGLASIEEMQPAAVQGDRPTCRWSPAASVPIRCRHRSARRRRQMSLRAPGAQCEAASTPTPTRRWRYRPRQRKFGSTRFSNRLRPRRSSSTEAGRRRHLGVIRNRRLSLKCAISGGPTPAESRRREDGAARRPACLRRNSGGRGGKRPKPLGACRRVRSLG
jgi:hypothetical protein